MSKTTALCEYNKFLKSGRFFEIFPKLSGNWEKDKEEWIAFRKRRDENIKKLMK